MANPCPPILVAIVGGSGAGKTWLARKLQVALRGKAARLSLDDFYRDRSQLSPARRARLNFDHPRAIDWHELEHVLDQFLRQKTVKVPCYDFATHCRRRQTVLLKRTPILLVEGLWLLRRPRLRRHFAVRIFIEASKQTRLHRRLRRDQQSRGRSRASVVQQFKSTVEPMHATYVAPQARWATLKLRDSWSSPEVKSIAADLLTLLKSRQKT